MDILGHVQLRYDPVSLPTGGVNGKFSAWKIHWKLDDNAVFGYVIQEMQFKFEVHKDCDGPVLSDAEVWKQLRIDDGNPKFHYLEAWRHYQYNDGIIFEAGFRDMFHIQENAELFQNPTTGTITITGTAAYYEKPNLSDSEDIDLANNFGRHWEEGAHANSTGGGSQLSQGLYSTIIDPTLPEVDEGANKVTRRLVLSWCCGGNTTVNLESKQ